MARWLLLIAGILTSAIALLHIIIVFVGAPAYRYFGAGERMARLAEAGSLRPALITLAIAVVFTVFSLYAFSGSGILRRLPLLRIALFAIGTIFVLRGLALFPQLMQLSREGRPLLHRVVVFSASSLITGLFYVVGNLLAWNESRQRKSVVTH